MKTSEELKKELTEFIRLRIDSINNIKDGIIEFRLFNGEEVAIIRNIMREKHSDKKYYFNVVTNFNPITSKREDINER
jgi:hypothetical protein